VSGADAINVSQKVWLGSIVSVRLSGPVRCFAEWDSAFAARIRASPLQVGTGASALPLDVRCGFASPLRGALDLGCAFFRVNGNFGGRFYDTAVIATDKRRSLISE